MKGQTVLGIAASLAFAALALGGIVHAQSPREQLQQMVEQLQKTPKDNALRERIIKLGAEINPAPAVPAQAEQFEGRAEYAFKSAKSEADMLDAAREYLKAVNAAPWVANYYVDLCTILEKASRPAEAVRACKFYLMATPYAPDAGEVRKRVAGLEYVIERLRGTVIRRHSCTTFTSRNLYENGAKVAGIGASKISLKLISSLYRGVWRNQLQLSDITVFPQDTFNQRFDLDPMDETFQLDDRVKGTPYYRLTIAKDGRVTFGGYGSTQAEIVTSITELYQLRNTEMNNCILGEKGGKFFVELAQGGSARTKDGALVAGTLYFESDCKGNLLGEKPGWFPTVFIPHSETPSVTNEYSSPAAQGISLAAADACQQSSSDGLGWLTQ